MKVVVALIVELVGTVALVYGAWMLAPWLAWMLGGLLVIAFAQMLNE